LGAAKANEEELAIIMVNKKNIDLNAVDLSIVHSSIYT
jgi:hypothetical protein